MNRVVSLAMYSILAAGIGPQPEPEQQPIRLQLAMPFNDARLATERAFASQGLPTETQYLPHGVASTVAAQGGSVPVVFRTRLTRHANGRYDTRYTVQADFADVPGGTEVLLLGVHQAYPLVGKDSIVTPLTSGAAGEAREYWQRMEEIARQLRALPPVQAPEPNEVPLSYTRGTVGSLSRATTGRFDVEALRNYQITVTLSGCADAYAYVWLSKSGDPLGERDRFADKVGDGTYSKSFVSRAHRQGEVVIGQAAGTEVCSWKAKVVKGDRPPTPRVTSSTSPLSPEDFERVLSDLAAVPVSLPASVLRPKDQYETTQEYNVYRVHAESTHAAQLRREVLRSRLSWVVRLHAEEASNRYDPDRGYLRTRTGSVALPEGPATFQCHGVLINCDRDRASVSCEGRLSPAEARRLEVIGRRLVVRATFVSVSSSRARSPGVRELSVAECTVTTEEGALVVRASPPPAGAQ